MKACLANTAYSHIAQNYSLWTGSAVQQCASQHLEDIVRVQRTCPDVSKTKPSGCGLCRNGRWATGKSAVAGVSGLGDPAVRCLPALHAPSAVTAPNIDKSDMSTLIPVG